MTHEHTDKLWCYVEKVIALPAQSPTGLRIKADAIILIQHQRDNSNSLTDTIMCGVGFRLALSLAADIQKWITRP